MRRDATALPAEMPAIATVNMNEKHYMLAPSRRLVGRVYKTSHDSGTKPVRNAAAIQRPAGPVAVMGSACLCRSDPDRPSGCQPIYTSPARKRS